MRWSNLGEEQRGSLASLASSPRLLVGGEGGGGNGNEEATWASPQELGGGSEPVTVTLLLRLEADWPRRAAPGSGGSSELSWCGSPQVFLASPSPTSQGNFAEFSFEEQNRATFGALLWRRKMVLKTEEESGESRLALGVWSGV